MERFRVIVSAKAQSDIAECISFVKNISIEAANELVNDFYSSFSSLDVFPEKNPVFEMPKAFPFILRKQVINKRYIALYTVEENNVVIYRVLDSRRKFSHLV